ncbi:Sec1 family domain-containing protein MIP3 [Sesamum angolense]|uniref:Sec1 family domain-containing protein MIP3 n=1 Tax=Sesamum angolense TaxID=2727404 RepID=A0AAE1WRF1_9LAMI|nr:Sec1 family domain-containing protein MIP3 [Sesamum angolense]
MAIEPDFFRISTQIRSKWDMCEGKRGKQWPVNVIKSCLDSVRQISENIKDAIVYLDAGSTESFQFLGAFPLFLELGARAVCSLENMSALDKVVDWNTNSDPAEDCAKLLVETNSQIPIMLGVIFQKEATKESLMYSRVRLYQNPAKGGKSVRVGSSWQVTAHRLSYSVVLLKFLGCVNLGKLSVSLLSLSVAHSAYPDSPLGPDAFHEYECLLNQDYEELVKKRETDVSGNSGVKESTASEDEGWVFVLPSEGSVAEASLSVEHENSISSGLPPLSTGKIADTEDFSPGQLLQLSFSIIWP